MRGKILLIIFLLVATIFFSSCPSVVFASSGEERLERIIDLSLTVSSLRNQIRQLLIEVLRISQPSELLVLSDYLKILFEEQEIVLQKEDFFEPPEDPHLVFAKILNLIPSSWQASQLITQEEAEKISEQFLSMKEYLVLDGLYGKIDMHEHYRAGGNVEEFLKAAGSLGFSRVVFLPTGLGPDNRGYETHQQFLVKYIKKLYPEKIISLCTIDEADPQAAEVFEQCLKDGGEGLKLLGGHPNFYDEPLDSENMYKVYQKAAEYQVPVLIHGSIINLPQLKKQLDRVYSDFPGVTFIHAHYCSAIMKGINLDQCAELLDKHPNLYIDLSMGGGIKRYHRYFRQDLDKVKDFILAYQDRILPGSDIILTTSASKNFVWLYQRMRCDTDLHQEEEYRCQFGEKDLIHQGFSLDREVLRKLYFENPKKVLGL